MPMVLDVSAGKLKISKTGQKSDKRVSHDNIFYPSSCYIMLYLYMLCINTDTHGICFLICSFLNLFYLWYFFELSN